MYSRESNSTERGREQYILNHLHALQRPSTIALYRLQHPRPSVPSQSHSSLHALRNEGVLLYSILDSYKGSRWPEKRRGEQYM